MNKETLKKPLEPKSEDILGDKYENHLPPEGINVSDEHPLKDFFYLVFSGILIVAIVVVGLTFAAGWLAPKIPFYYEQAIAERVSEKVQLLNSGSSDLQASELSKKRQIYLNELSAKYIESYPLPEDINIKIHYVDDGLVNAMATLGGHIFIYGGLFDALNSENALSFVLGHEIAHVAQRHPVTSLGRGIIVLLVVGATLGLSDAALPDWILSQSTNVTMLTFSREQEFDADLFALNGLQKVYGHVRGADGLFEYLQAQKSQGILDMEILQTHPLHESRIESIVSFMAQVEQNNDPLVPLPKNIL